MRGKGTLTPAERRGLALFEDPIKGGCSARCRHARRRVARSDDLASLLTDYGYDAAGAPRNPRPPKRAAPDLGVCERRPAGASADEAGPCASFRTPSLRNVAVRGSFMHNGTFTRLRDVVAFYATRETDPKRWYPSGVLFDDLPKRYRGLVNVTSPPYDRHAGYPAALTDDEIDAVVAFLGTLTDAAYVPAAHRAPAAKP